MTKQKQSNSSMTVTTQELSEILGLSSRRIQQLAKENAIVRVAHGKYDLPHSIQTYIEYIKEQNKAPDQIDLNQEKTLLTRANRMKAELEFKIMQGELHRSEDVESVMNDMLSSFRAQMLVIPGKAAPRVIGETDIEVVKGIIKSFIFEALQELSDYDPEMFYSKSKDKISIENEEENNDHVTKKGLNKDGKKSTKQNN